MRFCLLAFALALAPATARADRESGSDEREPAAASAEAESSLWGPAAPLRSEEIRVIASHARKLYERASAPAHHPDDARLRQRLLADARGMLRYAHSLDADDRNILELLAYVEEASGNATRALAGYRSYMAKSNPDDIGREPCLRYGTFLARLHRMRQAASVLQRCIGLPLPLRDAESRELHLETVVLLATLYAYDDRIDNAFALLTRQAGSSTDLLIYFALAVLYDKDEQITRAYEIMEKSLSSMDDEMTFLALSERLLDQVFVPAAERHYYFALLYESRGLLPEARAEWLSYIHSGEQARYSGRAYKHVRGIDELLENQLRLRRQKKSRSQREKKPTKP